MEELLVLLAIGTAFLVPYVKRRKQHKLNMDALNNCIRIMTTDEVDTAMLKVTDLFEDTESAYNYVYKYVDMPLGRASAFLNYHNTNIYEEEPYLFLCKRSLKDNEFREYGCIVARNGIYFSKDNPGNANLKEKQQALPGEESVITFKGLTQATIKGEKIHLTYLQPNKKVDVVKKIKIENKQERDFIFKVLSYVISQDIGLAMLKGNVIENIDEMPQALERNFGSIQNAHNYYNREKNRAEKRLDQMGIDGGVMATGVQASQPQMQVFYDENKHYMDGHQGHGYAAEYGNNTVDRFLAREVENAAQQLEHGHQVKHGADRIVNGVEIQTKYCKTAYDTIDAVFDHQEAKYIRTDGSGKMMAIEVPKDQYHDALRIMQDRIDKGQVPNVEPGESAENYIRKGHFTYDNAVMIAQSGTIESLTVDALSGVVCCSQAAGITAAITFALAIWNGQSVEDAFKQSLNMGLKVLGRGTLIYTLTMQLSRKNSANIFATLFKTQKTFENPAYIISENLAAHINTSALAKTNVGQALGLETVNGRQIIGGAITVAIVFGPDIARALVGRISPQQLAKNATTSLAGMLGAVLGQAIIPIPIVGGMVGGVIASFVVKKTLDHFIEDDAKEMFRILKEEFLDATMLAGLTHEEFEQVVKLTIGHKKLSKQLQKMYQSQEFRRYAREAIMQPAIKHVLAQRRIIIEAEYEEELKQLAENN